MLDPPKRGEGNACTCAPDTRPSAEVEVDLLRGVTAEAGPATIASKDAIIAAAITAANDREVLRLERILNGNS